MKLGRSRNRAKHSCIGASALLFLTLTKYNKHILSVEMVSGIFMPFSSQSSAAVCTKSAQHPQLNITDYEACLAEESPWFRVICLRMSIVQVAESKIHQENSVVKFFNAGSLG